MQQFIGSSENELLLSAEMIRLKSTDVVDSVRRKENSQYFTPPVYRRIHGLHD